MVRKLSIRSLRRGVGSMDYIHSLLIAEDDLDDVENEETPLKLWWLNQQKLIRLQSVWQALKQAHLLDPRHLGASAWSAKSCCKKLKTNAVGSGNVWPHTLGSRNCLDPDVLQLAIRNRGDVRNDREDNSTRSFRKASYRQYVLDRYGYLGKGNRKVCPACVVKTIRHHYPSQTGVYMGFRHEWATRWISNWFQLLETIFTRRS